METIWQTVVFSVYLPENRLDRINLHHWLHADAAWLTECYHVLLLKSEHGLRQMPILWEHGNIFWCKATSYTALWKKTLIWICDVKNKLWALGVKCHLAEFSMITFTSCMFVLTWTLNYRFCFWVVFPFKCVLLSASVICVRHSSEKQTHLSSKLRGTITRFVVKRWLRQRTVVVCQEFPRCPSSDLFVNLVSVWREESCSVAFRPEETRPSQREVG